MSAFSANVDAPVVNGVLAGIHEQIFFWREKFAVCEMRKQSLISMGMVSFGGTSKKIRNEFARGRLIPFSVHVLHELVVTFSERNQVWRQNFLEFEGKGDVMMPCIS